MNKEKGIIIGIVTMLTLILMLSISVYAEDLSNGGATIDFAIDTNVIDPADYFISKDIIAVDSADYVFEKDFQFIDETYCIQEEQKDTSISINKSEVITYNKAGNVVTITTLNNTYIGTFEEETELVYKIIIKETVCANYDTKQTLVKTVLANLEFKQCNEGSWYRIYKVPYYTENKNTILNDGEIFDLKECVDGKIRFEIDSFSSYTYEQTLVDLTDWSIDHWNSVSDYLQVEGTGTIFDNHIRYEGLNVTEGTTLFWKSQGSSDTDDHIVFGIDNSTDLSSIYSYFIMFDANGNQFIIREYTDANSNVISISTGVPYLPANIYSFKMNISSIKGAKYYYKLDNNTNNEILDTGWTLLYDSTPDGNNNGRTRGTLTQNFIGQARKGTSDNTYLYYFRTDEELTTTIDFTFEGQTPIDLNLSNAPNGVNINYTIEYYNATAMIPYLNYTLLSSNDNCIIYVNGVCQLMNGTYIQTEAETNTSTLFQFEADKDNFLSGVFNYNQTEMQNTPKLFYNTSTPNSYIRVDFDNLTNTCARSNLAGYFNSTSAVNRNVYYCNDNYSTGNPKLDANCELVGSFNSINETQRVQNLSYYDVAELSFCGDNLSIGFSSSGSFMIGDGAVLSRHAYINTSAVNSYYTSTSGNTWTQLAGTWDIHFHHWDSDLNFTYYACGIGEDGGFNCSSTVYDTLDVGDSPQLPPVLVILSPESGTEYYQNQSVLINWTSLDINNDNITYTLTINAVDILTDTELEQYTLNLSSYLGTVTIMITADDGTDTDTETVQISVSAVPTDPVVGQFNVGECPVDTTPLSILFLTICFVLTAFVVISYVLNSPFMMFGTGLGILICSWFIVGCVGGLGWTFIILGVGTLLYSMIGIKY